MKEANLINILLSKREWSKEKPKEEGAYYLIVSEHDRLTLSHVRLFKNMGHRGFMVHFWALKQVTLLSKLKGSLRWSKVEKDFEEVF